MENTERGGVSGNFSRVAPSGKVEYNTIQQSGKVEYNTIQQSGKVEYNTFFHHYQGSIDFNTVNIHRTVGMYFFVSTGDRYDIE